MKILAELWESYGEPSEKKVKCKVCSHYCIIAPNKRGFCQTRQNFGGELYTLVYGSAISHGSNDPIEKKPLYHFYPGSRAYSIATIGCNFRCQQCQNWEISQSFPDEEGKFAKFSSKDEQTFSIKSFPLVEITPEEVISNVKKTKATSIAYTYNEPTIWFEFVKHTAELARSQNIKNVLVTNGYSTPEANAEFIRFIDGANVDIKSIEDQFYQKIVGVKSVQPVLDTCVFFKENGIHLEITNLLIPSENDSPAQIEKLVNWITQNLGNDVPIHFSAYYPRYRLSNPPTSSRILEKAWDIAKEAGIQYVYLGNIRSSKGSNTLCPNCQNLIIKREGYAIQAPGLGEDQTCTKCGASISIIGKYTKSAGSFFF